MKKQTLILLLALTISFSYSQQHYSVHKAQKDHYDSFGFTTNAEYDHLNGFELMPKQGSRATCNLNKVVFGWHPYWVGNAYYNYQWEYLSDLSFFSYEVDAATGNANTTHGWETSAVIDSAQAHGVNVNLCVTLFSNHATFFGNPTAMQTLITNLISLVQLRNAKGVNIDFEGVSSSLSTDLTNFMIDLCNQMHTAIPGSQVSICTYAVDWSNLFDLATLNNHVDYFTIMGYAYYYSGSGTAGPTSPAYSMLSTYNYNLSKTITYYLNAGASHSKLVLGLPYYGHEWNTTSSTIPGTTTSSVSSRTYAFVKDNSTGNYSNRLWEPNSFTPYYVYNSGNWRQCFCDDEISLGYRYNLVNIRNIAGIGIWALGYDDGYTELWDLIRDKFTDCAVVPCSDTLYDLGGPAQDHYDNESFTYTIAPDNATGLSLTFNSFFLEAGFDSLWLYDGYDTNATLIGGYSGTTSPGTVTASGGAITVDFYSDGATNESGWEAVWQCFIDNIPPITTINANNWEITDFTASFTDTDNDSVDQKFYQVLDWNSSEWRGNGQNGFINDNFESTLHSEWNQIDGSWQISGNHLNQTDQASSNTNLYINVKQDSGYTYLYNWQMSIGGTGTNRRAGLHFFCDSADQSNRNNSYMVYFRVDQDKCQLYRYDNNVMGLQTDDDCIVDPNTWYDYKIIVNTLSGEIKAYQDDILVSTWIDASPFLHANSISLRTGNCDVLYDDVKVYRSRIDTALISVGNANSDVRYQNPNPVTASCRIKSIVTDGVGNFSVPGSLDVNIDWTPPSDIAFINDGISTDIDTTTSNTQLSANWDLSVDTNSNILQYWFTIGSSAGDSDIVAWTSSNLNQNITQTGLSLNVGNTYYFSVRAENGAGLISNITSSDGIYIDSPSASPIADFSVSGTSICTGQSISFYNLSTNGSSFDWTFDGGTPNTSNIEHPTVLYDTAGTFTVTLIVTNTYGSDTITMSNYIEVFDSPNINFTASPLTGAPPLVVLFTNNSTGANSYLWDFGDGNTSSDVNPYHIYYTENTFTVTLTAFSSLCPSAVSQCIDCILVEDPTSTREIQKQEGLFYPNPAKDRIYFNKEGNISLFSIDGKKLYQGYGKELNLQNYNKGVYIIKADQQYGKLVIDK